MFTGEKEGKEKIKRDEKGGREKGNYKVERKREEEVCFSTGGIGVGQIMKGKGVENKKTDKKKGKVSGCYVDREKKLRRRETQWLGVKEVGKGERQEEEVRGLQVRRKGGKVRRIYQERGIRGEHGAVLTGSKKGGENEGKSQETNT